MRISEIIYEEKDLLVYIVTDYESKCYTTAWYYYLRKGDVPRFLKGGNTLPQEVLESLDAASISQKLIDKGILPPTIPLPTEEEYREKRYRLIGKDEA